MQDTTVDNKRQFLPASFVGLNVALAIIASTILSIFDHPEVSWPICGMVAAVYGVTSTLNFLQKKS